MEKEMFLKESIQINVPVEKVWDALTNPEMTKKFMYCEVDTDWKVGSEIRWKGKGPDGNEIVFVKGELKEIEPNKLLRFTLFDPNKGVPDIPGNYVMVTNELVPNENGTELRITQGDYAKIDKSEEIFEQTVKGWKMTLPVLKKLLEE